MKEDKEMHSALRSITDATLNKSKNHKDDESNLNPQL